jgi:hypothetical protein
MDLNLAFTDIPCYKVEIIEILGEWGGFFNLNKL